MLLAHTSFDKVGIAIQPFWLWVTAQLGHEQVNEAKI
jgi:hypothetical protein